MQAFLPEWLKQTASQFIRCCLVSADEICQQTNETEIGLQGETGGIWDISQIMLINVSSSSDPPPPLFLPLQVQTLKEYFKMQRAVSSSLRRLLVCNPGKVIAHLKSPPM